MPIWSVPCKSEGAGQTAEEGKKEKRGQRSASACRGTHLVKSKGKEV